MSSEPNSLNNSLRRHICGGAILTGGSGEQSHRYCETCRAFTYDLDGDLPDGTNVTANRAAWDAGDEESPAAPSIGDRIEAGEGDDHDTGRIESIDGSMAFVAWDSGVKTAAPLADLALI